MVASHIPKIKILTNEKGKIVGLKSIWKGIGKEVAYQHLDLTIWITHPKTIGCNI